MSGELEPSAFQIKHRGIDRRDLSSLFYIMASGVTLDMLHLHESKH
jgi:hypothetical protein